MEKIGYQSKLQIIEKIAYKSLSILVSIVIGLMLSKTTIGSIISPFSLSVLSITPFTILSTISVYLGSFIGYLTNNFTIVNFKFICANTILLAIILISGKTLYIKKVYSPLLSGLISMACGILFIFLDELSIYATLIVICESVLCGCITYFLNYFIKAISHKNKFESKDIIALNITTLMLICVLNNYYIFGISLSLIFVITVTYLCAYYINRKLAIGFTASLSLLISFLNPMHDYFILTLYIPALICIAISKFDKKYITPSYYLPYMTLATLNSSTGFNLQILIAPIISSFIYTILPKTKIKIFVSRYIDIFEPEKPISENNDCESIYNNFCQSTKQLSGLINSPKIKPIINSKIEKSIRKYLYINKCFDINISNFYNSNNKQILSITFKSEKHFSPHLLKNKISLLCDAQFIINNENINGNFYKYDFEQIDLYRTECFALYKAKRGQNICGDNVSAFKSSGAQYNLILADGMGSGKGAYSNSHDSILLLKKFLKSGVSAEKAIDAVNCSIDMLKDEIGFSTVDLCIIDLEHGSAKFIKCGAYLSLIVRDNSIIKIDSGGFPVGLSEKVSYVKHTIELKHNDIIIMMSDGISATIDQIQAILLMKNTVNIEEITKELIDCAHINTPPELDDDMTVLCAKIIKRDSV